MYVYVCMYMYKYLYNTMHTMHIISPAAANLEEEKTKKKQKLRTRIELRNSNFSGVFYEDSGSIHFL